MDFQEPFGSLYAAITSGTLSDSHSSSPLLLRCLAECLEKSYRSTALSNDVSLDFIEQVCQDWGPIWQEKDLRGERESERYSIHPRGHSRRSTPLRERIGQDHKSPDRHGDDRGGPHGRGGNNSLSEGGTRHRPDGSLHAWHGGRERDAQDTKPTAKDAGLDPDGPHRRRPRLPGNQGWGTRVHTQGLHAGGAHQGHTHRPRRGNYHGARHREEDAHDLREDPLER